MTAQEIEKYSKATRVLHWVHTSAFVTLFLTGLILFIPGLAGLAQDSWTRVIHRFAAVFFVAGPVIYTLLNFRSAVRGVKKALIWGAEDLGWLRAAPRYYFLSDENAMPPQGEMNTGQKMWWFLTLTSSAVFFLSGLIMWVFKESAPSSLLLWSVFVHDVAFITTGAMLFVHIYLAAFHPLMRYPFHAWDAMINGKVPVEYAKSHHGKWFEEMTARKNGKTEVSKKAEVSK